jgi:hypothetical protein
MVVRWALLLLLAACSKEPEAPKPIGSFELVVLPEGASYRVVLAGPVTRGAGASTGGGLVYWSDSGAPARLSQDALQLVAAFGPELELAGEKLIQVQAKVLGASEGEHLKTRTFRLERGSWLQHPPEPAAEAPLPAWVADPALEPLVQKLNAAGVAAGRWLEQLDRDAIEAVVGAMTAEFKVQIKGAPDRWLQLTQLRHPLVKGERRELYRMKMPNKPPATAAGDTVLVQYQSGSAKRRVLERVVMIKEPAGWRIGGYAYEPLPQL